MKPPRGKRGPEGGAKTIKIWLDDIRPAPPGWVAARWPDEAISLLQSGKVTHLSLDHDLGDDTRGTGYDVLTWIERQVVECGFQPPVIAIHTANAAARPRMEAAVKQIYRLAERNRRQQ